MLRFGFISEYNHQTGRARVDFAEDEIVSGWLPLSVRGAQASKEIYPLAVGEQVACLMDERLERGVIVGATYNKKDNPGATFTGPRITGIQYNDGSHVYFNDEDGTFERKAAAAVFRMKQNLFTLKNDSQSLKGLLGELLDALVAETHPTPSGPSGPPSNLATYQAIKTKFDELFEE